MRGLHARGHHVTFLERNLPWYAENRDLPRMPYGDVHLYSSAGAAMRRFRTRVADADLVIVGSYVPDGAVIGDWVIRTARGLTAFYDIDTPVTLAALDRGKCDYVTPRQISFYDLYLSFTGGTTLSKIERQFGARKARPLYCSVDPKIHSPESRTARWDLGYIGTYSEDRQPALKELLINPARQFPKSRMVVAGAQYPPEMAWPKNVERIVHLAPGKHRRFYNSQRFTLNITRDEMRRVGYSPSVRLFEAAACGTPIISDSWPGLETFLEPGKEILIVRSGRETIEYLSDLPDKERVQIGRNARNRILHQHTAIHRAMELEVYVAELHGSRPEPVRDQSPISIAASVPLTAGHPGDSLDRL